MIGSVGMGVAPLQRGARASCERGWAGSGGVAVDGVGSVAVEGEARSWY
jgi:hypothetical protein